MLCVYYNHYKYSTFSAGDRLQTSESDVHKGLILTSKVGHRAEWAKPTLRGSPQY